MGTWSMAIRWPEQLSFAIEFGATVVGLSISRRLSDTSTGVIGGATIGTVEARLWQPAKRQFSINNG